MKVRLSVTLEQEQVVRLDNISRSLHTTRSHATRLLLDAALQAAEETGRVGPLVVREVAVQEVGDGQA